MRSSILLFMLLAGLTINAQNCKYAKNEVDKFTNKTILETKQDALGISGMGLGFTSGYSFYKSDDDKYIKFHFTTTGSLFAIREGDNVMMKLENGEVLSLKFSESVIADSSYNSMLKTTIHSLKTLVKLTDDDIETFKNNKIVDIRIYTTDGYIDDDVKEKRAVKFQQLLKCIN